MNEGRLVSNRGLDIDPSEFNAHIVEEQVPYSTALQARMVGRGAYLVGPLARFVHNVQQLSPRAQRAAERSHLDPSCRNPFRMLLLKPGSADGSNLTMGSFNCLQSQRT